MQYHTRTAAATKYHDTLLIHRMSFSLISQGDDPLWYSWVTQISHSENSMSALKYLLIALLVLTSCGGIAPLPVVTYRVNTATQQQLAYLQIDPNGYVVRTIGDATDEFQLSQADFALVLDQMRAANIPMMRLDDVLPTGSSGAVFHTILSGSDQVTFADRSAPSSVQPLLVTFQRILSVKISETP
jgi:hypothetical protein